jgi:hypothetical protein
MSLREARHFPPPWTIEELDACFVVRGQRFGRTSARLEEEKSAVIGLAAAYPSLIQN